LIGDGCYLKKQPLHYTNSDKELIELVMKAAEAEFELKPRVVKQKSWFHLYLPGKEKLARGKRNPIVEWLDEELGIFDQRSREKIIPGVVFGQPLSKIGLFLGHLWATDGCIHINQRTKGPKVRVYYASGNRELVEQVAHLLLRLGIVGRISSSSKDGYEDMWKVTISGKASQMKFLSEVGCVGKKRETVKEAIKILARIKENPNNDVVPKDVWMEIEKARVEAGLSTREFHTKLRWAYSGTQRYQNGVSRSRLGKICGVLNDTKLARLANSDLYWDEVVEIKELGEAEVYDATVPGEANFLANDIIVHNSIEQDADVVMFLYREDDENLSAYKLNIAKHRNGPLRTMDLKFRGDRIKFFGAERKRGE
jgi:replicative DNA helicase